jgi:hypothetical protein
LSRAGSTRFVAGVAVSQPGGFRSQGGFGPCRHRTYNGTSDDADRIRVARAPRFGELLACFAQPVRRREWGEISGSIRTFTITSRKAPLGVPAVAMSKYRIAAISSVSARLPAQHTPLAPRKRILHPRPSRTHRTRRPSNAHKLRQTIHASRLKALQLPGRSLATCRSPFRPHRDVTHCHPWHPPTFARANRRLWAVRSDVGVVPTGRCRCRPMGFGIVRNCWGVLRALKFRACKDSEGWRRVLEIVAYGKGKVR